MSEVVKMKVLVTGGMGYIGSHTVVELLENTISKSGMSHRLTALSKIADELRDK